MIFIYILLYMSIGIALWKLMNHITDGNWETVEWMICWAALWILILPLILGAAILATIFWALTSQRKEYSWKEYIKEYLEKF